MVAACCAAAVVHAAHTARASSQGVPVRQGGPFMARLLCNLGVVGTSAECSSTPAADVQHKNVMTVEASLCEECLVPALKSRLSEETIRLIPIKQPQLKAPNGQLLRQLCWCACDCCSHCNMVGGLRRQLHCQCIECLAESSLVSLVCAADSHWAHGCVSAFLV